MLEALALCLSIASPASGAPVQEDAEVWRAAVDATLRRMADAGEFSGVVLVSRGDTRLLAGAYSTPATPPLSLDSRFAIASISKSFNAACARILARAGVLPLDEPIGDTLRCHSGVARATARDLLSHRAGLRPLAELEGYARRRCLRLDGDEICSWLAAFEPEFQAGTARRYSSTNFVMLRLLIEAVTGQPYPAVLERHLFEPLGMDDSGCYGSGLGTDIVQGFVPGPPPDHVREVPLVPAFLRWGTGGGYSTAPDVDRWMRALAEDELGIGPPELVLDDGELAGERALSTTGGRPGFVTFAAVLPESDLRVVVLCNLQRFENIRRVPELLVRAVLHGELPGFAPLDSVPLDVDRAADCVGSYAIGEPEDGFRFEIRLTASGLELVGEAADDVRHLAPLGPDLYRIVVDGADLEFTREPDGTVRGAVWGPGTLEARCRRLDVRSGRRAGGIDWGSDLEALVSALSERHPALDAFGLEAQDFRARVAELRASIGACSDREAGLALRRFVAGIGDAHTRIDHLGDRFASGRLPVRCRWFPDGVRVTAVQGVEWRSLLGRRIVGVGSLVWEGWSERARSLVPCENESTWLLQLPGVLRDGEILDLLGLVRPDGHVVLRTTDGRSEDTARVPLSGESGDWLHWRDEASSEAGPAFEVDTGQDGRAAIVRVRRFVEETPSEFDAFLRDVRDVVGAEVVQRLVVDLRGNEGGSGELLQPLLKELVLAVGERSIEVVVLIDRGTYSAAVSFACLLEDWFDPVFVGEPTAGRPNGTGNPSRHALPASGGAVRIATRYVRVSTPEDRRPWIAPHVGARGTAADWRADRDVVLPLALSLEGIPTLDEHLTDEAPDAAALEEGVRRFRARPEARWTPLGDRLLAEAQRLSRSGDQAGELAVLRLAARESAHRPDVWFRLGAALESAGDLPDALAAFRRSAVLSPLPGVFERIRSLERR